MRKFLSSPIATIVMLVLAAGLIGFGGVRSARAALRIFSDNYLADIQLTSVYTELLEDDEVAATSRKGMQRELLGDLRELAAEGKFEVGKTYKKRLSVRNDGTIDEYVRVTVYKYWYDQSTGKRVDLDPSLIELEFDESGGWHQVRGTSENHPERTVLYYDKVLAGGDPTSAFTKSITISNKVYEAVSKGEYKYENLTFRVEAVVDAVQTHHHEDAMTGVWGEVYNVSE